MKSLQTVPKKMIPNLSLEVNDEVCCDEQYENKVKKSEKEFSEYFKIVSLDPRGSEEDIAKSLLKHLDDNLKKATIEKPDVYKFVKSGKSDGIVKIFIKTKNIPEILETIKHIASKNIEITKMPKWRR